MENRIKTELEISKFHFDLSPSRQVTIGIKGYTFPKTVYVFKKTHLDHNPPFTHTASTFDLILTNDVFAAVRLIMLC